MTMFPPPEMRVPIVKPQHAHEQPSSSSADVAANREAARDEHNYNVRAAWAYIYNDDLSPRDIGGPHVFTVDRIAPTERSFAA